MRPSRTWKPIEQATMSYGHGISVSLLQLARAYSVFARDGEMIPRDAALGRAGGRRAGVPPRDRGRGAQDARDGGQPAARRRSAQIPGYRVGGKTGTAHKLEDAATRTSTSRRSSASRRSSSPRVIVAVMIDEPSAGKHYGGRSQRRCSRGDRRDAARAGRVARRAGQQRDPATGRRRSARGDLMSGAPDPCIDVAALMARLGASVPDHRRQPRRAARRRLCCVPGAAATGALHR